MKIQKEELKDIRIVKM